jgi:hypothetical protein
VIRHKHEQNHNSLVLLVEAQVINLNDRNLMIGNDLIGGDERAI